jgi:hypothetical protein
MAPKFKWMAIIAAELRVFLPVKGMRVPEVLPKAPDGIEPPQKAVPAFPFPLGYGATSKIQRDRKTTNKEATECPNSEMTGLTVPFDCMLRRFTISALPDSTHRLKCDAHFQLPASR